jgi:hypothetical protein
VKLRDDVRWLSEHYQASQQRICGMMEIAEGRGQDAADRPSGDN